MIKKITISWLMVAVVVFSSCVSSKKYKAATADAAASKSANEELTKKNQELQRQVDDAISSNKMLTTERDRYQQAGDSARQAMTAMQGPIDQYVTSATEMQKKVADRLADYAERGANVEYKDGMVYVTLSDELLFRSGSSNISKDGETALGSLASVLNENPDMKIMVVGHTDDRAGRGRDNWSLSTDRANSVVRELKDNKIDPDRLTAAGQGQYNPVADNSTSEGRGQNRRTEIVLVPAALGLLTPNSGN